MLRITFRLHVMSNVTENYEHALSVCLIFLVGFAVETSKQKSKSCVSDVVCLYSYEGVLE